MENLYGPTELTVACTLYRWDCQRSPAECELGIVPIGEPYPGMEYLVVNESLHEVSPGETGQLLLTGPQRTLGYWNNTGRRLAAAFVLFHRAAARIYYCTGDRVRRPLAGRPLTFLGRLDFQIKIRGGLVELGEVEAALRDLAGVDVAIAVGWPPNRTGPTVSCVSQGQLSRCRPAAKAAARAVAAPYGPEENNRYGRIPIDRQR